MIRRVTDNSIFNNEVFNKLANTIKEKENKKLYRICDNDEKANVACQEIKIKGLTPVVEKIGNSLMVYSVIDKSLTLENAVNSGQFKKLAWGRYSFQNHASINGFQEYNFDDGSIWKVITDENGEQYLVKEVEDEDEDKIIRQKVASKSNLKLGSITINDSCFKNVVQILYGDITILNSQLLIDVLSDQNCKNNVFNIMTEKMNALILESLQKYNVLEDSLEQEVLTFIESAISTGQISSLTEIESQISTFVSSKLGI